VNSITFKIFTLAILCCNLAWAQAADLSLSHALTGGEFDYTVQKGDFLISIGARFGEPAEDIARINSIPFNSLIFPGRRLHIDNRHVVPERMENGIIINLPQGMLFFFQDAKLVGGYPVGLGKSSWPTPTGEFHVVELRKNPTWLVPISIQEEMLLEGKAIQTRVPPGKDNPLGNYWMGLSIPGYGIHGTNAPASVYHFQSHGCIRLQPADAEALYSHVKVGTTGKILYIPLLLAKLDDGRIYLEVHRDVYNKGGNALKDLMELAAANHLANEIDWQKATLIVEQKEGLARQINLPVYGSK
jgi:L,D-transpeptidase ErfK/SrfK